ncbi:MAG TPA: hypothetical protein DDY78_02405 [Planctomycetales bacterium]|jgi:hypothetical protein|nr:hypothetical protein [Planctomycetales bacterium]
MTLPSLFLLAIVGASTGADGAAPAIRDDAGLFSRETGQKADEEIAALRDVYHLDIVVETAALPPVELHKKIAGMKPAYAAPLLHEWAVEGADQAVNKGVYILICKEPGYVDVVVSPEVLQHDFTGYDANRLRSLLKNMKAGPSHVTQRDKRLLEAVVQIREAVRYNLRPPFPWLQVSGVLVGVLGLWGVLSLARQRLRSAEPSEPLRLNLFNALLGGMFGTVAAHWIIDTLFVTASRSSASLEEGLLRLPVVQPPQTASDGETVEPAPETQPDRLDLAARDEPVDELRV